MIKLVQEKEKREKTMSQKNSHLLPMFQDQNKIDNILAYLDVNPTSKVSLKLETDQCNLEISLSQLTMYHMLRAESSYIEDSRRIALFKTKLDLQKSNDKLANGASQYVSQETARSDYRTDKQVANPQLRNEPDPPMLEDMKTLMLTHKTDR